MAKVRKIKTIQKNLIYKMIRSSLIVLLKRGFQASERTSVRWFSSEVSCKEREKIDTNEKLVKVSIIGLPNSGKSTFINMLVQHRVSNKA